MNFLLIVLLLFAGGLSLYKNSDIFSPAKFFLLSFAVFHAGILFMTAQTELWMLVFIVLLVAYAVVLLEEKYKFFYYKGQQDISGVVCTGTDICDDRLVWFLWMLSLPGLFSQAYMFYVFGGIEGFINSLAFRVVEWRGLGWAKTLISIMAPVNLVYFAIGLSKTRSRFWWRLYAIHFLCLMVLGVLLGSRSSILNVIALQCFTFNYIRKPINPRLVVIFVFLLVLLSGVLGVIRDGLKFDGDELVTGLNYSESSMSYATFYYGVEPLSILVKSPDLNLAYGSTFVSLFTNMIPRAIWPDKPDSGGVFFTKVYTGDAWDGASNLTPTFMGEWVINFGWELGLLSFVISYVCLLSFVVKKYWLIRTKLLAVKNALNILDFIIYVYLMWSIVALMTGEVTNVILNMVLSQLIPLFAIKIFVKRYVR